MLDSKVKSKIRIVLYQHNFQIRIIKKSPKTTHIIIIIYKILIFKDLIFVFV